MTMVISGDNGLTYPNSTTQASAGQVLQVVNAIYSTSASSTVNTYANTGLTATITPKFATSKILVLVNQNSNIGFSAAGIQFRLLKNGTALFVIDDVNTYVSPAGTVGGGSASTCYLDSPATTSATTYSTQFANRAATGTVVTTYNGSSTITLMEIAA